MTSTNTTTTCSIAQELVGQSFPKGITVTTTDDKVVNLDDIIGNGKATVIDLYTSW